VASAGPSQSDEESEPPSTRRKPSAAALPSLSPDAAAPTADRAGIAAAGIHQFSPEIGQGLGWLAGSSIALLTLLIPMGSVLLDRAGDPDPAADAPLPAATARLQPTVIPSVSSPVGPKPARSGSWGGTTTGR